MIVAMMTLHKLSAGDGYTYYTHQVATGDALREQGRELGDYYTVAGMPPGQWIGGGVHLLESYGDVRTGDTVTEQQMADLFGAGAQPMTGTETAMALSDAEHAGRSAASEVIEAARIEHAQRAWEIYQARAEGKTQAQIAEQLSTESAPISEKTISRRVTAYRDAGNPMTKNIPAADRLSREEFMAGYTMTRPQQNAAEQAASTARSAAITEHLKPYKLGSKFYTYRGRTPFQQRFHEEVQRHNRTQPAAPTREDFQEIRNRVGGELFRKDHGRDAKDPDELSRWITSQDQNLKQSVAGYDLVFTPTKSVSIAWGLGDENLRKGIEEAHEAAINDALAYLEDNAVYTRRGYNGVRQVDVNGGLIATKFRHHDSRAGDPNLHDHVVVANKVQAEDGTWLSLDGRMLYRHNVAASEVYNSKIIEHIHQKLGLEFTPREQRGRKVFELAGIDPKLISGFSSRSVEINQSLEELEAKFIAEHGHAPTMKQRNALAQQATLATRPAKEDITSLQDLNTQWRARAQELVPGTATGEDLATRLHQAAKVQAESTIQAAAGLETTPYSEHAQAIIERLETQRSTWTVSNVTAEAHRYYREIGQGAQADANRIRATVDAVKEASVGMSIPETLPVPEGMRRADGSSVYRMAGSEQFTSERLIAAEDQLVRAATTSPVIPTVATESFEKTLAKYRKNAAWEPSAAQVQMARTFATSENLLAVGIGPAGAGKTTSTTLYVNAAKAAGAQVIGLAPTAAAATVMSAEMGIDADTVDSFLAQDKPVAAGSVLLVDEIGMVSTPNLAALITRAEADGAVVRGIGDPRQLSAIGSGGALRLIEHEAGAVHLEDVHRFRTEGEADASLALREPAPAGQKDTPFTWYQEQGRITAGPQERMLGDLFSAWSQDTDAGLSSLMMAGTGAQVTKLNELAQAKAMADGLLDPHQKTTTDAGHTIHAGDTVVTRRNDRQLRVNRGKDFVKNGDTWTVHRIGDDGSLDLAHTTHSGTITVPASYAAENIELGYARTIARAQGATVDRAHVLLDATTSRENAYVGTSRGREQNRIYVAIEQGSSRDEVLEQITSNYEQNLPIHEQVANLRAQERAVAPRVERYQDLALYAQEQAVATAARQALGEVDANKLIGSAGFGAFAHEVAQAMTADGVQPQELIRRTWNQRDFGDAQDIGAVMHYRVQNTLEADARQQAKHPQNTRPFSQIPDEHLDALFTKAQQASAEYEQKLTGSAQDLEDPQWHTREFGLVPTDQLNARRVGLAQKMRDNDAPEWRDLMAQMDAEVSRRRWSSPGQQLVEEVARGERSRKGTDFTLAQHLDVERKIRAGLLPRDQQPAKDLDQVTRGVSGHTVDSTWAEHELTPKTVKDLLGAHHAQIGELTTLRGQQIAAENPEWAQALGPVPAAPKRAAQWYRVAGEVEAYRARYQVPDTEHSPIPKAHLAQEGPRGDAATYLQGQVTDVHKRQALSSRTGRQPAEVQSTALQATDQRMATETPTPAETTIQASARERRAALIARMAGTKETATMAPTDQNSVDRANESEMDKKLREMKERAAARASSKKPQARGVTENERQQQLAAEQRQQRRGPRL